MNRYSDSYEAWRNRIRMTFQPHKPSPQQELKRKIADLKECCVVNK